ncbi:MAG: tyrosine-protein phosphatase [Alphaproteobacteria bacterium]
MTRLYNLKSVHNFRDFGNYETKSGRNVAPRKLFRSAHLSAASEGDLEQVDGLNIGLIVDLRHRPERDRQPNKWPDGKTPAVYEYPDAPGMEKVALAPHEMFIQHDLRHPDDARNYMNASYSARPNDAGFRTIFANTLKFMARDGAPLLIHCAAGKDRTGTLAAVILAALGVDEDIIMEDFMLTMEAVDVDSFLEPAAAMMGKKFGRAYDAEALRPMFGVEPEYLRKALQTIGDMDHYIENTLGLSTAEKQSLQKKYLAD